MLDRTKIERAVDLQATGYRLLQWLEQAFDAGFIAPEAAHNYASVAASTYGWIEQHFENLPANARPRREDLQAFALFFSTYLTNTFDLEANPGERLYSPDAHCFCPCCSWMVRVPHLTPKKLRPSDKKAARNLRRQFLRATATELGLTIPDETLDRLLDDPDLRAQTSLCAYATDLLERIDGFARGPASLALWRGSAWTKEGSPKKGFTLLADDIMSAEAVLRDRLVAVAS